MLAHLLQKPIGLGVQAAGVEGKYLDVRVEFPGHVQHDDVVGAAERQPEVVEVGECQLQNLLRGFAGVVDSQLIDVEGTHGNQALNPAVDRCATVL